jgi:hypothetical protein
MGKSVFGHRQGTMVNGVWTPTVITYASLAALKAEDVTTLEPGVTVIVDDGTNPPSRWQYVIGSTLTADDFFVVAPTTGAGRYVRASGHIIDVALPIGFALADAAVLATTPTNSLFLVERCYWEVTTGFTGGTSSAIGISSGATGFTTRGDLLGGSGGDVAATLVAGKALGTIGGKTAAGVLLPAASTIRFDRIASVFTAGAGYAHIVGKLLINPGA